MFYDTHTCPQCKHYILTDIMERVHKCPNCGRFFTYKDLLPSSFKDDDYIENPKGRSSYDWIGRWESLKLKDWQ